MSKKLFQILVMSICSFTNIGEIKSMVRLDLDCLQLQKNCNAGGGCDAYKGIGTQHGEGRPTTPQGACEEALRDGVDMGGACQGGCTLLELYYKCAEGKACERRKSMKQKAKSATNP